MLMWNWPQRRAQDASIQTIAYLASVLGRRDFSAARDRKQRLAFHTDPLETRLSLWRKTIIEWREENCFILRPGTSSNWSFDGFFPRSPETLSFASNKLKLRVSFWCWMKWGNVLRGWICWNITKNIVFERTYETWVPSNAFSTCFHDFLLFLLQFEELGCVTSIESNHKNVPTARKGMEVCIKIEPIPGEAPKMFGRHFDETDMLVSKVSWAWSARGWVNLSTHNWN